VVFLVLCLYAEKLNQIRVPEYVACVSLFLQVLIVLLVTAESGPIPGTTTEDQLMNLGKKLIDTALTPNFGWREDGQTTYIADPTEPSGNKLAVLRTKPI